MWEWLLAPVDPSRAHAVGAALAYHARLMVLAWAVCVPIGIIAARFYKITPRQNWPIELDNQAWWITHRVVQYGATVFMIAALLLILWRPQTVAVLPGPHACIGWTVLALTATQVVGGILRGSKGGPTDRQMRGDHYDMTPRRLVFEYAHKSLGYVAWLLSCVAVFTGLWQANGPNWMWIALGLWYLVLVAAFAWLQAQGRATDTYQAIWGSDPNLPGNKRPAIGIGVRTHTKSDA
ncbi:cytochrome b561 domain-containing protein [uncultured Tateyamaria sp.]|uniref:cytochrome b561 domain-containing protein n=1 Tax=uncultured Tateyamaria sp. TaxID=455651 RepID=UPI00260DD338|nr:cytochrome b561 domain-containing protein [uncultured Tateyamaria sp.]